jgi:arginine repressor
LNAQSGTELAIAAAGHLTFVKNKDKFTRKELLEEMQQAPSYYKSTYSNNLSRTLDTLIKSKRFHQNGKDVYALSPQERQSLEAKLA